MIKKNKNIIIIIFIGFVMSVLLSINNLNNHDKNLVNENGNTYHKMIKYDAYRYHSHGDEIKNQIKKGTNFFKTGREHYTKYLPPRLIAAYYYFSGNDLFNNLDEKKINTGIHLPYLIMQCALYFFSVFVFFNTVKNIIPPIACFFTIFFLCFEPTINQYHGTFWSESIFFSIQVLLISLILRKNTSVLNYLLIGFMLGLLSLQKEYSIFYILPVFVYFYFIKEKLTFKKTSIIIIAFFIVQSFLGLNNYVRSGQFYIMTADSKVNLFHELVSGVMVNKVNKTNISLREFYEKEGDDVLDWLLENSIDFDSKKLVSTYEGEFKRPSYMDYRESLNEKNKIKFDQYISYKTLYYFSKYPLDFTLYIVNKSLHITLLNPFHIYSDHHFMSGEKYYGSKTHSRLIPIRAGYTMIIYLICLFGLFNLFQKKQYNILIFSTLSMMYFYGLVSWNGNTRYFVPVVIYMSFFFGYGIDKIIDLKNKIKI